MSLSYSNEGRFAIEQPNREVSRREETNSADFLESEIDPYLCVLGKRGRFISRLRSIESSETVDDRLGGRVVGWPLFRRGLKVKPAQIILQGESSARH